MKISFYLLFCLIFFSSSSQCSRSRLRLEGEPRTKGHGCRDKRPAASECDRILGELSSSGNGLEEVVSILNRAKWKECAPSSIKDIIEVVCNKVDAERLRTKLTGCGRHWFDHFRPVEISSDEEGAIVILGDSRTSSSNYSQGIGGIITISSEEETDSGEKDFESSMLPDSPPGTRRKPEVIDLVEDSDDDSGVGSVQEGKPACRFTFNNDFRRETKVTADKIFMEANAIIEKLGEMPDDQPIYVPLLAKYKMTDSKLDASSLKRLLCIKNSGWLDDKVINSYGRLKASQRGQDNIQYHHIDSLVINPQTVFPKLEMIPGKIYFWPLSDGSHWSLLIIEIIDQEQEPVFKYFDSLYELADRKAFLTQFVLPKLRPQFPSVDFSKIKSFIETLEDARGLKQKIANALKQLNNNDCGVYVAEMINRIVFKKSLQMPVDTGYIRKRMAVEILQVVQLV